MSTKHYLLSFFIFCSLTTLFSQMVIGPDTLVGNEWIHYGRTYYKFSVNADGVYRISGSALASSGINLAQVNGSNLRVYFMGQQVPLLVSTNGAFSPTDYIELYGFKNRSEMDRFLFKKPDTDMLNPDFSLYTDNRYYYLTTEGEDVPLRVTLLDNNIANPPAASPYFWSASQFVFTGYMYDPYTLTGDGGAVSYSSYMHGEGFGKGLEATTSLTVPAPNRPVTGPDALLHIRMTGGNYFDHEFKVTWNDQLVATLLAKDIEIIDTTLVIPFASLQDNNQFNISCQNAQSRYVLASVTLTYPESASVSFDTELKFNVEAGSDQYYVFENFNHQVELPFIYSQDGTQKLTTSFNGLNQVHFVWPASAGENKLHIVDPLTGIRSITALEIKVFEDFQSDNTEYVIITHPNLMEAGDASAYAQYRSSAAGGSYRVKAYYIQDIYDQFGYGFEKHPQAIRNFVEYMHRHWPAVKMIFIVGRAIEYNRSRFNDGTWENLFFVPTFGKPGADNLLGATLWDLVPRYPIGRLAAITPAYVQLYLNKIIEHDAAVDNSEQTLDSKAWMKYVLHLSGGNDADQQDDFKITMAKLAVDIENSEFGAKVFPFYKVTSDIIGESQSRQIEKLLHEGSTLINYLGHSSANTFEFTVNDPAEWNNKGRYPIFSAMGCSAGQIHIPTFTLSDRYVQIPDEGCIAFISGSGSQFPNSLITWAKPWYNYFGNDFYGTTLGASILFGLHEVNKYVDPELNVSNPYRYLLEQQTLQGDPAIKFNPLPGPDYLIDRSSFAITPGILNTALDSFGLHFSIYNIGRNLHQKGSFRIRLVTPGGDVIPMLQDTFRSERFETPINVRLALDESLKAGAYRILIDVDPDNELAELPSPDAELNNQLVDNLGIEGIQVILLSHIVTAVYPEDFAIVNNTPVLIAAGSNAFEKHQDIALQIDTTALFNSPFLTTEKFLNHSALVKWTPTISFTPNQVYYWRVSYDSLSPTQGYLWSGRSFIYKPDSPLGWNQSDFYQLTQNNLQQIIADSANFKFGFGGKVFNFRILNRYQHPNVGGLPFGFIDNIFYTEFFSKFSTQPVNVFVVAIDPVTGEFMMNPPGGLYGSFNNLGYAIPTFPFSAATPESRQNVINFIDNVIPSGYYVFFYTYQRDQAPDYFPQQWLDDEATFGKSIYTTIEKYYPESIIRSLASTGSVPYIVLFKKDHGGIEEVIASDTSQVISLSYDVVTPRDSGRVTSALIGPASKWHSIHWDIEPLNIDTSGSDILSAFALSADLSDTLWISRHLTTHDTVISDVDADQYPFMRLSLETEDDVSFTPSDIHFWRVLYDGYPEFVINPDAGFEFIADTLFQGQDMSLRAYVENISHVDAQQIPVSLRILSGATVADELMDTIPQLNAGSQAQIYFSQNTKSYSGDYQVLTEVNAARTSPEVNFTNNIGVLPMYILTDKANPILDVTFDGYHILDGDLVASRPVIQIELNDENTLLRLDDTSSFDMYLEYPSDIQPRHISFSADWVEFIHAGGTGKNTASVRLTPYLNEDGIYKLRVNAKDASGNIAGDNDYIISFKVINEASISHIYNYPNPFSTSTRFVYTLTGEGSPAHYKIQIMSVSGRIVREITQDELGPLSVGTHMTDFFWDGTDQYGNTLAVGTYFYRMIVKDQGQKDFKHYDLSDDQTFFKNGWGKLVIIR